MSLVSKQSIDISENLNNFFQLYLKILNNQQTLRDYSLFDYKYYEKYELTIVYNNINDTEFDYFILDKTNSPIALFFNVHKYDENVIDELMSYTENDWSNVIITKLQLHTKHICIFNHKNSWLLVYSNKIEELVNSNENEVCKIIMRYFENNKINLDKCDNNLVYHLLIKDALFKKNNLGLVNKPIETCVNLMWTSNKKCQVLNLYDTISTNDILLKINENKKIYFSCLDEMLMATELMNNEDMITKNIQNGGYLIYVFDFEHKIYKLYCVRTEIYKYVASTLLKYDNQYKSFLELYQNDKLTEVLPYLHKYPADVIRRINVSVKILSKEILNIYHLTRKKQNKILYDVLPISYRKTLYDLHKIYVNQKFTELLLTSNELIKEKKSISVDVVYSYLKNIKNVDLIKIFDDRRSLINNLKKINFYFDEILSVNNIDIITQTELMFQH